MNLQETVEAIKEQVRQFLVSRFPDVQRENLEEMVDRMTEAFLEALVSQILTATKTVLLVGVAQALAVLAQNPANTVGAFTALQQTLQGWRTER